MTGEHKYCEPLSQMPPLRGFYEEEVFRNVRRGCLCWQRGFRENHGFQILRSTQVFPNVSTPCLRVPLLPHQYPSFSIRDWGWGVPFYYQVLDLGLRHPLPMPAGHEQWLSYCEALLLFMCPQLCGYNYKFLLPYV